MPTPTKKAATESGLPTATLAVAAGAIVLVCACAALLLGTAGGTVSPASQVSPPPPPTPAAMSPDGRLDAAQEWALIGLMLALPLGSLVLLWLLAWRHRPPQDAPAPGDWPWFKALSAEMRREKVEQELERVGQLGQAGAQAANLEQDTLDAKSFALMKFSEDTDDWLRGPASLERDSLDTAFDAVRGRGDKATLVDVLYLPKASAVEASKNDGWLNAWREAIRSKADAVETKLHDEGAGLTISVLALVVTSGLLSDDSKKDKKKFEAALNDKLKDTKPLIKTKYYDLGKLRAAYGPSTSNAPQPEARRAEPETEQPNLPNTSTTGGVGGSGGGGSSGGSGGGGSGT